MYFIIISLSPALSEEREPRFGGLLYLFDIFTLIIVSSSPLFQERG